MLYRAILFDLDDTLYDLRSYWRGRLHEAIDDVLARFLNAEPVANEFAVEFRPLPVRFLVNHHVGVYL